MITTGYAPAPLPGTDINPRPYTWVAMDPAGGEFLFFDVKDHVIYQTKGPVISNLPYLENREGNTGIRLSGQWDTVRV